MSTSSDFKDLQKAFSYLEIQVNDAMREATLDVAKEGTKKLKQESRQLFGKGSYANGWTYKQASRSAKATIYNKKYQLTHLLEKGHDIVYNGKKVGRARAFPHIKPVEEFCIDEIEKEITEAINNIVEDIQ